MKNKGLSIWFLIGLQLTIYGVLIAGAGIYGAATGTDQQTILGNLHAGIWWGGLMLVTGLIYTITFRPRA
jgi:hypothetical protein